MSKHTPGPWKFESLPSSRGEDWSVLSVGGLTVESPSALTYVACHQSDQRLIAAAPDLLEALQMLVGDGEIGVGLTLSERINNAKRAIAKATWSAQ